MENILGVFEHRSDDDASWKLPPWNHAAGQLLFPLFIRARNRLIPIGTAFSVCRFGLLVSARHCIEKAFEYHHLGRPRFDTAEYDLDDVGFSILHHRLKGNGQTEMNIISVSTVNAALPSDVVYMTLDLPASKPLPAFSISPIMPRHDAEVLTLGYCDFRPLDGIPYDRVKAGQFDWKNDYSHTLRACVGRVCARFPRFFAAGYLEAGCFMSTCDTRNGQSGGPVFNEQGYVSGINSAGASVFFCQPSNLVSSLYPALPINVRLQMEFAPNFRMGYETCLLQLIRQGIVASDGSEQVHRFVQEGGRIRVDPPYGKDDLEHIYDDLHGFQAGTPARTEPHDGPPGGS